MATKEQILEIKNHKRPKVGVMPSRDLNFLYPTVQKLAKELISECVKVGIPIIITQTGRSEAYQNKLYAIGRTTKGKIVTNCKGKSSPHCWGYAFDFCINIKGKAYDAELMKKVGKIGMKLGLEWGGSWKSFVDMPHFQYSYGYSDRDIRNGKTPLKPII